METFTIILAIIALAFGVLQIILFFKLWGMTNDVKEMKKVFIPPMEKKICCTVLKQAPNDILFDYLFDELYRKYMEGYGSLEYTINKYKALYAKYNIKFPEAFENVKTYQDFKNLLPTTRI